MAQPLPVAIDIADAHCDSTYGISVFAVLSMHDTSGRVWACAASPTFRRDLAVLNWGGQASIGHAGAVISGWFRSRDPRDFPLGDWAWAALMWWLAGHHLRSRSISPSDAIRAFQYRTWLWVPAFR